MSVSQLKKWFSFHREAILQDFFQFLRFKSIGVDSAYSAEVFACAKWLENYLGEIGMQVEMWTSSGNPCLFAEKKSNIEEAPTLLIYHHYDVQPVDPLPLWKSDPFEPVIREEAVYARGAQDNKGQCFYTLTALKAFLELTKEILVNIKIFIEGEEESGSDGTREILERQKDRLQADHLLVIDSYLAGKGIPTLTLGVRGLVTLELHCSNSISDLHSGIFGGIVYNPNRALVQALAACWDDRGRINIPHFYEEVIEVDKEQKSKLDFALDLEKMKRQFGIQVFGPEPGFSVEESAVLRPTLEINGISGGYAGEGFKTIIPKKATAKISCRLVPHQDPNKIAKLLRQFIQEQFPSNFTVEIKQGTGEAAFLSKFTSEIVTRASRALEEVMQKPCQYILSGASIPIVPRLVEASGAEAILMGFGLEEDHIHAPNEHFGLDRFELGFLTVGRILSGFSEKEFIPPNNKSSK